MTDQGLVVVTDDPFDALRRTTKHLAESVGARILALGEAAIPSLLAVLRDEELSLEESPAQGWPPIHAVELLVALRAEAAIVPLFEVLRQGEIDDILSTRIAVRLPELGAAVLEPALAELAATSDPERKVVLCEVLSRIGVRDERVWQALARCFDREPILGASSLAHYGDPRALPLLERQIFAFDTEDAGALATFDLQQLLDAYEHLAGKLTDELADHVDYLFAELEGPEPPPAVSSKIGRNDPCPCGSGKKFKRCCLE